MTANACTFSERVVARALGLEEGAPVSELTTHLASCRTCEALAAAARDVPGALALPQDTPAAGGWDKLARKIEADRGRQGLRVTVGCSYCHGALAREDAVYCAACLAPHHSDCFGEHGKCSAAGCGETRYVESRVSSPAGPRRAPGKGRGLLFLGAGLLLGVGTTAAVFPLLIRDPTSTFTPVPIGVQRPFENPADLPRPLRKVPTVPYCGSYDEALAAARRSGKPLFLEFTGRQAVNARQFEETTLRDPEVVAALADFEVAALLVDGGSPEEQANLRVEAERFGSNVLPLCVVVDRDGNPHGRCEGAVDAPALLEILEPWRRIQRGDPSPRTSTLSPAERSALVKAIRLQLDANQFLEARRLVEKAASGDPPSERWIGKVRSELEAAEKVFDDDLAEARKLAAMREWTKAKERLEEARLFISREEDKSRLAKLESDLSDLERGQR